MPECHPARMFRFAPATGFPMRILLVEDDPMIGKTLVAALQQDGYAVDWVKDGQAGRLALDTADGAYALVLLDLGLPRKNGLELLKELRRAGNRVRVLILTARDAVSDRVAGSMPAPTTIWSSRSAWTSSRHGCGHCCVAMWRAVTMCCATAILRSTPSHAR